MATGNIRTQQNFAVETVVVASSVSLSANTAQDYSASVAKTGYEAIGIIGVAKVGSSYAYVTISRFYIDNEEQTAHVAVSNATNSSQTVTIRVQVLYQRL